ncbi:hypothetical protein BYT27DRAFT_7227622 [Phlegmacium glaucopus]|nr:hypothetical protein BYT27DRAFT_7227622 [Phlegmacium glaucopus]
MHHQVIHILNLSFFKTQVPRNANPISSSAGRHSGNTAQGRISTIKTWHTIHNIEWKGSTQLQYVLNALLTKPLHMPINTTMLIQLINTLNLTDPLDTAFSTCMVTAFWGQCCLGELLPSCTSNISTLLLTSHTDLKRSPHNSSAYTLYLPHTKTHHHDPINPIALPKNHLYISHMPHMLPLFAYATHDRHQSFTKGIFLQCCNYIWQQLGYPHMTGHCFHIGGTTELLIAGTPPDVIRLLSLILEVA